MTFTPTKEELIELGLHEVKNSYLFLLNIYRIRIYYDEKRNIFDVNWIEFYPKSLDSLRSFIETFTPPSNQ